MNIFYDSQFSGKDSKQTRFTKGMKKAQADWLEQTWRKVKRTTIQNDTLGYASPPKCMSNKYESVKLFAKKNNMFTI